MKDVEKLLCLYKEKHGDRLDVNDGQEYFMFFKDGYTKVTLDEEEGALKVEVVAGAENKFFAYNSSQSVRDLLGK